MFLNLLPLPYHKIPASIIADFAEAGQCHVVYEDSEKCLLPKEPQLVKITELIEPITIELSKPNFVAKKRDTHAIMHVHRTGSLDGRVKVKLENQDPHLFHESPELEVVFEEGQSVAPVKIALKSMAGVGRLAVKHAETDHRTRQANLGNNTVQQITILDEEEPSVIAIDTDNIQVDLDKKQINVPVLRCGGEDMVAVKYHTIEDTAQAGIHYLHQVAQIVFAEGENQTNFSIPIVTLPVEESVKLKVQLHSVQGNNASINPNFELVDVVIPGIEHSGVFDFTQPTYKVNQSSGKVLLEIQRQRGTRGHVTVPIAVQAMSEEDYLNKKELKSNKLNSQTYHCVFEDGQKIANVEINISQEAKTDLTQVLACTITDIVGENVEIGHQKNCHVEVTNDIDGGTIGFVNQKIEADALKDIRLKLDLNCTQPGNEVSCKWRIIGGKPLINYRSESSSGGRVQWPTVDAANAINVMLLNDPTGEDAEFIVELYDPSTGARIDEANSQCKIVVKNYVPDISVPVEQIIRVKQSEGMAIIPLQRSITQVGKLALKWSSVGDEAYKKTIGEIEFPEGQNDTLIKIPLLAEPQEMDKHEFTLKLEPLRGGNFEEF